VEKIKTRSSRPTHFNENRATYDMIAKKYCTARQAVDDPREYGAKKIDIHARVMTAEIQISHNISYPLL
jgi:hypothetical protein